MKILLILIFIFSSVASFGQKISNCNYKIVDSLLQYDNAQIIKYKDKFGKQKSDTVYYKKQKCNINIESVSDLIVYDRKL